MDAFFHDFEAVSASWWPFIATLVIFLIGAIRLYVGGNKCPSLNRIDGQVVLVTGASGGIGFITAKELIRRGATVILAVRNAEKGKKALDSIKLEYPDANVIVKMVNMADFTSIRDFSDQIKLVYNKVDILINNAGVLFHSFKRTVDGNETTMSTNYFGPFLLTHLLLPLLYKSDNGRVINVSAIAHVRATLNLEDLNGDGKLVDSGAFGSSKLALTMFTKQMASLLKHSKITFNAVNPGLVRGTGHLRNSKLCQTFAGRFAVFPWMWLFMRTPTQGSQTLIYAAVEPSLNNVSGCYLSNCEIQQPAELVNNPDMLEKLYAKTCEIVGINGEQLINKVIKSNELTK